MHEMKSAHVVKPKCHKQPHDFERKKEEFASQPQVSIRRYMLDDYDWVSFGASGLKWLTHLGCVTTSGILENAPKFIVKKPLCNSQLKCTKNSIGNNNSKMHNQYAMNHNTKYRNFFENH